MLRLGILMMVLGLVSAVNLINVHSPAFDHNAVGGILLSAGLTAVLLALVMDEQAHSQATVVRDRRKDSVL